MPLFAKPRDLLFEAATAELFDTEESEEVKDVAEELNDTLTNNIPIVGEDPNELTPDIDDDDETDPLPDTTLGTDELPITQSGDIAITAEAVMLAEASITGRRRYFVSLETVMTLMETEGEQAAEEAMKEPDATPSEEEVAAHEPEAVDVIDQIASANGVDADQVTVIINSESVRMLASAALLESKSCKRGGKAKAKKKLKKTNDVIESLKGKVRLARTK